MKAARATTRITISVAFAGVERMRDSSETGILPFSHAACAGPSGRYAGNQEGGIVCNDIARTQMQFDSHASACRKELDYRFRDRQSVPTMSHFVQVVFALGQIEDACSEKITFLL